MGRLSSFMAIAIVLSVGATPAFAKTSISRGQSLCKSAVSSSQPKPESVRIDDDKTRVNNDVLMFSVRIRSADGTRSIVSCTVDRQTDAVTLQGDGALPPAGDVATFSDTNDPPQQEVAETLSADDLRTSAEMGDVNAQLKLGQMYSIGQGVERNDEQALQWFRLAADQGSVEAQFRLGSIYEEGIGVLADDLEAAKWYRLAFDQGNYEAMLRLEALSARSAAAASAEKQQAEAATTPAPAPSTLQAVDGDVAGQTRSQPGPSNDSNFPLAVLAIVSAPFLFWFWLSSTILNPVAKCPNCKKKMRATSSRREHSSTFQKREQSGVATLEAGTDYWNFVCDTCKTTAARSRRYKKVIDRNPDRPF